MTAPARRGRAALAGALALVALGVGLYAAVAGRPSAPPPPPQVPVVPPPAPLPAPPPAPASPAELKVTGLRGQVERSGGAGDWRPLGLGDVLGRDEQVRTGPRSAADLAAGDRARLTVGERTEIAVRELTAAVHRYRLTRGLVTADYQPDGARQVRIEGVAEGGPVAEASAARFHVSASGLSFAVAADTGGVSLSSAAGAVALQAGQASRVAAGQAPSSPMAIPTAVLLKVAEASRIGADRRCRATTGQADPSALVTVDGEEVPVGPDGRFPIHAARPGRGAVVVRVVLPGGRTADQTLRCREDAEAPIDELRMRWKRGAP